VKAWILATDEDSLFVSALSFGEIRQGVERLPDGGRRRELETWLRDDLPLRFDGRVLDVTRMVAEAWGALTADAKRRGVGFHVVDAYLAATALVHGMTLVTRNTRDFRAFGLTLVNPWEAAPNSEANDEH
jgi:predicted nucleic acid-binding protein